MPYLGRAPTGTGSVTEIDGDLKITGQLTANDTLFKMIMDTAANLGDNILIEDGGTDGSGTNAGDDICLEKDLQVIPAGDIISISGVAGAAGVTLGTAVATTSGTTFDFTGIPSGTKRITVNLAGVHFNAGVWPLVQIGDSGGVETSGYSTVCCYLSASVAGYLYTNGWNWLTFGSSGATYLYNGTIILTLVDPATYSWAGSLLTTAAGTRMGSAAGDKSLSAELDRVRITTNSGGSAFNAGKVNITYE